MFEATDIPEAPWWTVESDDKRAARINSISHILSQVPYEHLAPEPVEIPERPKPSEDGRPPREDQNFVEDLAGTLKH